MSNECDIDRLQRWFDGEAPPADGDAVRQHLTECASCRAHVGWWKLLREGAGAVVNSPTAAGRDGWPQLRAQLRTRPTVVRRLVPTVAAAIAAAAAVVLIVLPWSVASTRKSVPDSAATSDARTPLTTGTADAPSALTATNMDARSALSAAEALVAAEWRMFASTVRDAQPVAALTKADLHTAAVIQRLREDAAAIAELQLRERR